MGLVNLPLLRHICVCVSAYVRTPFHFLPTNPPSSGGWHTTRTNKRKIKRSFIAFANRRAGWRITNNYGGAENAPINKVALRAVVLSFLTAISCRANGGLLSRVCVRMLCAVCTTVPATPGYLDPQRTFSLWSHTNLHDWGGTELSDQSRFVARYQESLGNRRDRCRSS